MAVTSAESPTFSPRSVLAVWLENRRICSSTLDLTSKS